MKRIDVATLRETVLHLAGLKHEGNYWDFKREWHSDKTELLHGIICLANNLEQGTSYLIVGIDEDRDYEAVDVADNENRRNTQGLTDFITKVAWFGNLWPDLCAEAIDIDGATIDVIVIGSTSEHMPYMLSKPNGKLRPYAVYLRRNDTNTPINETATLSEMEALWRHHFGLDLAPIERLPKLLEQRSDWAPRSQIGNTEVLYHRYEPKFTIDHSRDRDSDAYEYYMFRQTDTDPIWYTNRVLYKGEQIFDDYGVALDGGRYFTIVPEMRSMTWWGCNPLESNVVYGYFSKGTLEWSLHRFLYKGDSGGEQTAYKKFVKSILVYESEDERKDFEDFLQCNRREFEERVARQNEPYIWIKSERQVNKDAYAMQLKQISVLRDMLDEYRYGRMIESRVGSISHDW